jgi:hypothetical protein
VADSRHTQATKMVMNDMRKVIDSFSDDTPFMAEEVSKRTQARRAAIENAPPDIKALKDQGFSQAFILRLLKAQEED